MAVHNGCDHIEEPCNKVAEDPEYADNGEYNVVLENALSNTVNCPYDVEHGNAKNDFGPVGKLINPLNEVLENFLHLMYSPYKEIVFSDGESRKSLLYLFYNTAGKMSMIFSKNAKIKKLLKTIAKY